MCIQCQVCEFTCGIIKIDDYFDIFLYPMGMGGKKKRQSRTNKHNKYEHDCCKTNHQKVINCTCEVKFK